MSLGVPGITLERICRCFYNHGFYKFPAGRVEVFASWNGGNGRGGHLNGGLRYIQGESTSYAWMSQEVSNWLVNGL